MKDYTLVAGNLQSESNLILKLQRILRKYIHLFQFVFLILTSFPHPLCQRMLNGPHSLKAIFCETVPLSSLRTLFALSVIQHLFPKQMRGNIFLIQVS